MANQVSMPSTGATTKNPFQSHPAGGVQLPGGGWVPGDHPLAAGAGGGTGPKPPGSQPNPALYSPYGQYPGRPAGTTATPQRIGGTYKPSSFAGGYTPASLPSGSLSAYNPGNLTQFAGANQGAMNAQVQAAIQRALSSDGSLPVAQMKGAAKDSATSMAEQLRGQVAQSAASRGTAAGGSVDAQNQLIGSDMMSSILGTNRDIDIANAQFQGQERRSNIASALDALDSESGRTRADYDSLLRGQLAQEGLNFQGVDSQNQAQRFALERALAQEGQQRFGADDLFRRQGAASDDAYRAAGFERAGDAANAELGLAYAGDQREAYQQDLDAFFNSDQNAIERERIAIQNALGTGALDIDRAKLSETGRQFDRSHGLDWAQFLRGASEFDQDLDYRYGNTNLDAYYRWLAGLK